MRKVFSLLPYIVCVALTVTIVSCSKEGQTGPAGPAGPAGPQGAAGPAGQPGAPGTANVIYSGWLDVTYTPIKDTQTNGKIDTVAWVASIPAPKLDADILSKGEIKVYFNANTAADPAVFPLPITDMFAFTGVLNINAYYTKNAINLYGTDNASTITYQGTKYYQYRYVLIPGGTSARMAKSINWNDYKEVQKYLGLKD